MNPTPAPIRIHLTRQPRLVDADGASVPLSRKDAALLAILAVDESASKDRIAHMLWPREQRQSSLLNLRQRRFRLGRAAGVPLVVGDDILRLSSVAEAPLDPFGELGDTAPEAELLDGLAFDDCPEFADWLDQARGTWRNRLMTGLERESDRLESQGLLAQALVLSRRITAAEPLSDRAHRRLIWQLFLQGDMGGAMTAHQLFCERLAGELGEYPDDATRSLVARTRLGEFTQPGGGRPLPATQGWLPRFVGRGPLLQALRQAWSSRQPVLIEGAPGIGKSRLVAEAMRDLGARRSLHVPVYAGAAGRPYAVLAHLLSTLWLGPQAVCPQGHLALPDWARRELSALLPELQPEARIEVNPLRLLRAVELALLQAELELIVLDDLQQVDLATLELLPALSQPMLPPWWLVCRSGERPPAVDAWIRAAGGAPLMLDVQPLDRAAVCRQAGQWAHCAEHTQALLDLLVQTEHWSDASVQLSKLAAILTQQGCFERADALMLSSQAWRELLGPLEGHMQAGLDVTRAVIDIGLGRLARAQQAAQRALMACQRSPELGRIGARAADVLVRIHLAAGQTTAAREVQAVLPTATPAQRARAWWLMAAIEHVERALPEHSLALARSAAAESQDALLMLRVAAEDLCTRRDSLDARALLALETQAADAEQAALATRLAWHRVGALMSQARASDAASLALRLLDAPSHPEDILPCHWLDLAARALRAVKAPQAPQVARRALQAHGVSVDGLGSLRPPERLWPRFPDTFTPSTHPAMPATPMPGPSGSARPTLRSTP